MHNVSPLASKDPSLSEPKNKSDFDKDLAFSRNIGWITTSEQKLIFQSHVGIIGLGGVGGQYAEALARLGVGNFTICDPDSFEIENTNRQNECKSSNYGKNKAEVIKNLIQDINPSAVVHILPGPLKESQVEEFCKKIDVYFDALDFFVLELRRAIFQKMRELNKPSITAAPIGTGTSSLVFTKDSMSFDDYFGLHKVEDPVEKSFRFLIGLAPSLQHTAYFQNKGKVSFENKKAPSLPMGVYACASVAVTSWLKLLLKRGRVLQAPHSVHFDPYLTKIKITNMWWGHRNPLFQLKIFIFKLYLKTEKS